MVTAVTEVQGMEGDTILLQDMFAYRPGANGATGDLVPTGLRPRIASKVAERGVEIPAEVFRVGRSSTGAPRVARAERERDTAEKKRNRLNGPTLPGEKDGLMEVKR
jgi:hypothetical protein